MYEYQCKIVKWLDGDTCDVHIDLGFDLWLVQRVRVDGINSPEIHSKDIAERKAGLMAQAHAYILAPHGVIIAIKTAKAGKEREKFGRWLAKITLPDGRDFATAMTEAGQAKPYHGEKR